MKKISMFLSLILYLFVPLMSYSISFEPQASLTGIIPAGELGDDFGQVLYFDNHHLFVGAPAARPEGQLIAGAVYVYKKVDHQWNNTQIITTNGLSDHFGAVTIKVYKDWLFIAAIGTPIGPIRDETVDNQDFTGSIQIYRRDRKTDQWIFFQSLDRRTPGLENLSEVGAIPIAPAQSIEQGAGFGLSFDITDQGILLVGAATQENNGAINSGVVYSFKFKKGSWRLTQTILNPDGIAANDTFGGIVKIYKNFALISNAAIFTDVHFNTNTSTYLFEYRHGKWQFVQKVQGDQTDTTPLNSPLLGPGIVQVSDNFGGAIAFSNGWALISAPFENLGTSTLKGAAYLFQLKVNKEGRPSLVRKQKIISDDPNAILTGLSVALDGDLALVGDPTHAGPEGQTAQGAILVYQKHEKNWVKEASLFDPTGTAFDMLGNGVAVNNRFLAGGTGKSVAVLYIDFFFVPSLSPFIPFPLQPNKTIVWKVNK